jgi:hypothetical protein
MNLANVLRLISVPMSLNRRRRMPSPSDRVRGCFCYEFSSQCPFRRPRGLGSEGQIGRSFSRSRDFPFAVSIGGQIEPGQVGHNGGYSTIRAKGPAYLAVNGSRCSCLTFKTQDRALTVICVAIVIAVGEVRSDFAQVAQPDRLIAHHTEGLRAGRPAIHQDESHVAPPDAKQNTVSVGWGPLGGGAQR